MKTDSLFYRLFQTAPAILLELVGQTADEAMGYEFRSVELKQTAFRIDGMLSPTEVSSQRPVYFVEVQFQRDEELYHRLFSELLLYLKQYPETVDWRVLVIYPRRGIAPQRRDLHRELLASQRFTCIHLEELAETSTLPLGVELVKLVVTPQDQAIAKARELLARSKQEPLGQVTSEEVIDLIETIIVYKFENLGREEIEAMLGLTELKQTRVYQEALEEGREEGLQQERQVIIENLLRQRLGELDEDLLNGIVPIVKLPADRFLAIVVALSQPSELWFKTVSSILQARFESVPESLLVKISKIEEPEQQLRVLRKAIAAASPDQLEISFL